MNQTYFDDLRSDLLFKFVFGENNEVSRKLLKIIIDGATDLSVKSLLIEHPGLFVDLTGDSNELLTIRVRDERENLIDLGIQGYKPLNGFLFQLYLSGVEVNARVMDENYLCHGNHRPIQIAIHDEKNPFRDSPVELLQMQFENGEICPLYILEMYHVFIQNVYEFEPDHQFLSILYFLNHPEQRDQLKEKSEMIKMIENRIEEFNKHPDLVKFAYLRKEAQEQFKKKRENEE